MAVVDHELGEVASVCECDLGEHASEVVELVAWLELDAVEVDGVVGVGEGSGVGGGAVAGGWGGVRVLTSGALYPAALRWVL